MAVFGCSDHFLVWMEIGKVTKRGKKVMRVLKRWRLERFDDVKVRVTYQKALHRGVSWGGFGCSNTPLRVQVINYSLPNLTYG